jgi:hypothetical protein
MLKARGKLKILEVGIFKTKTRQSLSLNWAENSINNFFKKLDEIFSKNRGISSQNKSL